MKTIAIALSIALVFGPVSIAEESLPPSEVFVLHDHTIISNAAVAAHVSPSDLLAVAQCESSMNPRATNGISFGILQFVPPTFYSYAKKLNIQNPDIWNVSQQAQIAAFLFSTGQQSQWVCWGLIHGKLHK